MSKNGFARKASKKKCAGKVPKLGSQAKVPKNRLPSKVARTSSHARLLYRQMVIKPSKQGFQEQVSKRRTRSQPRFASKVPKNRFPRSFPRNSTTVGPRAKRIHDSHVFKSISDEKM